MKKSIRIICVFALTLLMALSLCSPAFADDTVRYYDEIGLLSEPEADMLEADLDAVSESAGVDVVIAVFDDMYNSGYTDIQSFADDFYDRSGFSPNGIALVISMADRDYQVTTAGSCIETFTDDAIYYLEDRFLQPLSSGDYYTSFSIFAAEVSSVLDGGYDAELYNALNNDYNSDYGYYDGYGYNEKDFQSSPAGFNWITHILISLAIGIIVALIVVSSMKSKLKSVAAQHGAANYAVSGSPEITGQNEVFLYSKVAAVPKPQEPRNNTSGRSFSGGGSSVHMSGGGVSHGGHGGKF